MRTQSFTPYNPVCDEEIVERATTALVVREWSQLRVERVDVHREPTANGTRLGVWACISLGAHLLPADVRVELLAEFGRAGHRTTTPARLWSTRCYQNGTYLFEGSLPLASDVRETGLTVRVTPAPHHPPADVAPIVVWVETGPHVLAHDGPAAAATVIEPRA